jgi:starch phosphorylase
LQATRRGPAPIEGVTGWSIGAHAPSRGAEHATEPYEKLGTTILPLYYNDRQAWVRMMKETISKIAAYSTANG